MVELGRVAGHSIKCELYFPLFDTRKRLDVSKKVGSITVVAFTEKCESPRDSLTTCNVLRLEQFTS